MKLLALLALLSLAGCGGGDNGGGVQPPEQFRVVIVGEGSGAGQVRATQGSTINCIISSSQNCDVTLEDGTALGVEATADHASAFIGWSGDAGGCGSSTVCTVTVDRALTIRARFEITVSGSWSGPVTDNGGLDIGTMVLTLTETNGTVSGNGTIGNNAVTGAVSAAGTYVVPTVSLALSTPGFEDINLRATVSRATMTGTLNGSGFRNTPITLTRQ